MPINEGAISFYELNRMRAQVARLRTALSRLLEVVEQSDCSGVCNEKTCPWVNARTVLKETQQ